MKLVNPIQTGLFLSSGSRERGLIQPQPLNSEKIKVMATKLGVKIVRP